MNLSWDKLEPNLPKGEEGGHRCEGELPKAAYGAAIRYFYEDVDGKLWISNDEYASQVNFCPYCGCEAKVKVSREQARNRKCAGT